MSQVLHEFKRRQDCRTSFLAWCRNCGYEPAKHHRLLIAKLELGVENLFKALVRGHEVPDEKLRFMFLTPPGSAKSTYISKLFPPWFLAQVPRLKKLMEAAGRPYFDLEILATTHNGDLSIEFGSAARNLAEAYPLELGYTLNREKRASDSWRTSNGGKYHGATVGAGISGLRFHAGFIDDFVGNEEDAISDLVNNKIWTWWLNDFNNRAQPIALRFLVANHRNEDDLVGRLLDKEKNRWDVTRLRLVIENEEQALEDPLGRKVTERLWPEYFTEAQVKERMENPNASGIQQQEPFSGAGELFLKENLENSAYNSIDELDGGTFYGASDHAITEEQRGDNSCLGIGVWKNGFLFIHPDLAWDRMGSEKQISEWLRLGKTYNPIQWRSEKGQVSKSLYPFLALEMRKHGAYFSVNQYTPTKSKVARAQTAIGMSKLGLIKLPKFAPWYARFKNELLSFPNGRHDDGVDFLAHLTNLVYQMTWTGKKVETEMGLPDLKTEGMNITMRGIREQMKKDKYRKDIQFIDR